jgi:hypothetical protein
MRLRTRLKLVPPVLLGVLVTLAAATSASAATPAPDLTIHSLALPTHFSSADTEECLAERFGELPCDSYRVTVTNSGALPAKGPIVLTDQLPAGVKVRSTPNKQVRFFLAKNQVAPKEEAPEGDPVGSGEGVCHPEAVPVSCEFFGELQPDQRLEMKIFTTVEEHAKDAPNVASVSEAGTPVASTEENDAISSTPPAFGPDAFLSAITSSDGTPDTQAGDHPYELVMKIDVNTEMGLTTLNHAGPTPVGHGVRDVVVDLPLGLLGSATSTPKCTFAQLQFDPQSCALDTVVGHIAVEENQTTDTSVNAPIYNMVPEHGVAAEFGFHDFVFTAHVIVASVVPTPAGYVLRATARELPDVPLSNVITTFYGDPAAKNGAGATPTAMFTNSSDCSGHQPRVSTLHMDSWEHPGPFAENGTPAGEPEVDREPWVSMTSSFEESPPVTGCDQLRFQPEAFTVKPETTTADSPTGLSFDLKIPQTENPETLATPPLRDASVTLPPGLTVDPSAASGLQACSEAQIGWLGRVSETNSGLTNFTPAAPTCPEASRIGSVEVTSPLIETTLQGSVYLATQDENPFHSLLAGYIVIDDPTTGTIVKIPGELKTNPETGQITGVFKDNPQIPFSDLKIHFFGGPRGDLATPEACGTYTTTSDFSPWSAPESGPDATPSDSFPINSGCVSGFTPAFHAGTLSNQAGGFSPFTLSLSRNDNEEGPAGLTVTLPTGLLGKIAGVAECSDAQVAAAAAHSGAAEQSSPSCPSSSQLGTVQTAAGPGPNPFVVGGKAYLTGPYKGAPYGVAVIVPAVAGPFDLGTVVIRQALHIDPNDAHVTDVSDPFPTILQGIPLRIKRVSVTLDRPSFTFNPTSCEQKTINATVTSIGGAHAAVSSRFQAAGCQSLPFSPQFSASTQGKTSKQNGASLHVNIASAGIGQASIARVDLEIPKIMPTRLTTIQKACTAVQFNANPAGCPAASVIATATVHTPLLNGPVTGPAYFVSHGGAAFPDVEMVLQDEGVTLVVDGKTQIKNGATFSHFETVPDVPFTSFEFNAPEGPYSIFGANGNLCQTEVRMPTKITAQNGAVLTQSTLVEPEGCPNTLTILSHSVNKRTITLKVVVPSAGKLTATGKGLSKATKTAGGRGILTLTLKATKPGKLKTKVKLSFTPTKGRKLAAAVAARFKG